MQAKLRPNGRLHIACENLDFSFYPDEIQAFRIRWDRGDSIPEIARELDRDQDEVAILAIDQARAGRIKERPGGAMGREWGR